MLRCTTKRYDALYARWLEDPGGLLDLAGWKPGEHLLDLCGGTGAVSLEAVRRGARLGEVLLLDLAPRCGEPGVVEACWDVDEPGWARRTFGPGAFDVVVCRQAVGYLDPAVAFPEVAGVLRPGGRFTFNNFVRPGTGARTYVHGGTRFLEASATVGRTVWHLQAGVGVGADVTRFRWHSDGDLRRCLERHFDCDVRTDGKSQRWLCVRVTR